MAKKDWPCCRARPQVMARRGGLRVLLIGDGPRNHNSGNLQSYTDFIDRLVYPRLPKGYAKLTAPLDLLRAMARRRNMPSADIYVLFGSRDYDALASSVMDFVNDPEHWLVFKDAVWRFVESERNPANMFKRHEFSYMRVMQCLRHE